MEFKVSSCSSSSSPAGGGGASSEKNLIGRIDDANYENSGVDVSLTLKPPEPPVKKCCRCGKTRTPLWRSGPDGPKTLCNACGIRYRKEEKRLTLSLGPNHNK